VLYKAVEKLVDLEKLSRDEVDDVDEVDESMIGR
jgi:hypothetical protein